jgi:hypothetical protein
MNFGLIVEITLNYELLVLVMMMIGASIGESSTRSNSRVNDYENIQYENCFNTIIMNDGNDEQIFNTLYTNFHFISLQLKLN